MRFWQSVATLVTCALLVVVTVAPAAAREDEREHAYLALGDSVAFGFDPTVPLDARANPARFVGYPEALAQRLELDLTNASCPGEASGGFISLTGADNSCRLYSARFPLHVSYSTSQLDFAVAFLRAHPRTRLVTIDIGANDLFLLQRQCNALPSCVIGGLPAMLNTLAGNLNIIYSRLRSEAHYHHRLVAVTYYALDYRRDPNGVLNPGAQIIAAVNATVASATVSSGGRVADGFGAFKAVAESTAGGDSCAAGLLIRLSSTRCDIHPSPLGRDLLAAAIQLALRGVDDD